MSRNTVAGGELTPAPRAVRSPRRHSKQRADRNAALLFLLPAFAMICLIHVYPIGSVIWTALSDTRSGEFVGLQNFNSLFADPIFRDAVVNNAKLFFVIPVIVVGALLIAQILFDRIAGWRYYRSLIFLPYIMPVVVAAMVFGQILQSGGLVNIILKGIGLGFLAQNWLGDPNTAVWSVGGVVIWREIAFGVILFLARMTQLPPDLYDAAKVDGANWWQRLRHVTVPQMSVIVFFYLGILFVALFNWVFNYVLVLTKGGPGTSTYVLEYYVYSRGFMYGDFGTAAALSTVMLVGILTFMLTMLTYMSRKGIL